MDSMDRAILSLLQTDGRASVTEIAGRVGLSLSACHRRIRDLESAAVIRGYQADLDAELLGLPFEALVFVTMRTGDATAVGAFEEAVQQISHVTRAYRLFGEPDYQLFVRAESQRHYQQLYDEALARLPGVQRLTSTLVMKTIVEQRLPL